MKNNINQRGFSLIELLFVMVIIAIIAAIAIPGYIGLRNRAYEASIISSARGSVDTLNYWLHSSLSSRSSDREADTNCNGEIDTGDKTNIQLFTDGVASTFVICRNTMLKEKSPYNNNLPLWSIDNTIPGERITLIQLTNTNIRLVAKNNRGDIVFERNITAD